MSVITVLDKSGTWLMIPLTSVSMLEAVGDQTLIHLNGSQLPVEVNKTMGEIEEDLIYHERLCRQPIVRPSSGPN